MTESLHPALYDIPHRGLRWALGSMLHAAGSTDYADAAELGRLRAQFDELAELTEQHMRHEEQFLHGALRDRGSPVYITLEEEHAEHRSLLANLNQRLAIIARATAPEARGREFTLALSRFVADSLEHMDHEESNAQAIFEQLFTPQELTELHDNLVASIPPHELAAFLKIILPGMHHKDRVAFLSGPRQGMPRPLFDGLLRGSVAYLSAEERQRLLSWADAA
jgi:hemerythrin